MNNLLCDHVSYVVNILLWDHEKKLDIKSCTVEVFEVHI